MSAARDALTIRPLESAADLHACVALQDETWGPGFSERVPYAVLWFTRRIGGILIGAFDGDALIGFVFGITGWRDGRPLHWSDMLAVRATTRDRGIGIRLKQAQRSALLADGVADVHWTFDPLQSRNAYLNFERLGIVTRTYLRDVYATSDSPLHHGIGTDRLLAEWRLNDARVQQLADGARPAPPRLDELPAVNPVQARGALPACARPDLAIDASEVALLIPVDIDRVRREDLELAREWRATTRAAFEAYLGQGFVATRYVRRDERVGAYVLARTRLDA